MCPIPIIKEGWMRICTYILWSSALVTFEYDETLELYYIT